MRHGGSSSASLSLRTLKEYLSISIEPDVQLPDAEEIQLDQCLLRLLDIDHVPVILNCKLLSVSSLSNTMNHNREAIRMNHYLKIRQPRKFYWMRNIKYMFLNIQLPSTENEQISATLIEFHSCKRIPYSARVMVHQVKSILLRYYLEERSLKVNLRESHSLLQLTFTSLSNENKQLSKGIYYKWSDEERRHTATIQFDIDYHIFRNNRDAI